MELIVKTCHQRTGELSTLKSTKIKNKNKPKTKNKQTKPETKEARVSLGKAAHPQAPEIAVRHV